MRPILGIDPGEVRIGAALSDATQTLARPLEVILHRSRDLDAQRIAELAGLHSAERIVVGVAPDADGTAGPQARRALRLVEAIRARTHLPVDVWDESGTTTAALELGPTKAPVDAVAAAVILQEYLDARKTA